MAQAHPESPRIVRRCLGSYSGRHLRLQGVYRRKHKVQWLGALVLCDHQMHVKKSRLAPGLSFISGN
jgi:hypothetical protein